GMWWSAWNHRATAAFTRKPASVLTGSAAIAPAKRAVCSRALTKASSCPMAPFSVAQAAWNSPASDKSSASAASVSPRPPGSCDMLQQSVEIVDVLGAQHSVLIDRRQRNVVEAQDRIAAVDQKPTPAIRYLAGERCRAATPCTAVRRCHRRLAR